MRNMVIYKGRGWRQNLDLPVRCLSTPLERFRTAGVLDRLLPGTHISNGPPPERAHLRMVGLHF